MGLHALNLSATKIVTSSYDDGAPEDRVKFTIARALDSRLTGIIKDKSTSFAVDPKNPSAEVETSVNTEAKAFDTVLFGLKGVDGLLDDAGQPVPYATAKRNVGGTSYTIADPEFVKRIPMDVVNELAGLIDADNSLTAVDAKN